MPHEFSEPAPGGNVSGRKRVGRQSRGFVLEYDVASTAEEPVVVHLADRVPAGRAEEFGFHREHEPAEWTIADGDLEMTVALRPGEDRTVVLGLAADGDLPDVPAEPTVDVRPADAAPEWDDAGATDEAMADAAPDDGNAEGFFEQGPTVDADGGRVDAERHGAAHSDADRQDAADVVSSLVAELEAGTVPESDIATLREHLGAGRPESEAARLEYVQKRLGDFDAYVDALEDLLSVHGSGEDAVTELEGRLDDLADDIDSIRRRQDELADRIDGLAAVQESQSATVDALEDAHEDDVAAVRSDLAALEAEVEAFASVRRALVDGFQGAADAAGDATSEIADADGATGTEPGDGSEATPDADAEAATEDDRSGTDDGTPTASHFAVTSATSTGIDDRGGDDQSGDDPTDDDRNDGGPMGVEPADDGFVAPDRLGESGDDGADADDTVDEGADSDTIEDEDAGDDSDVPVSGAPVEDSAGEGAGDGEDAASDAVVVADAEARSGVDAAVVPFEGQDATDDGGTDGGGPAGDDPVDGPSGDDEGEEGDEDGGSGGWTSSIF